MKNKISKFLICSNPMVSEDQYILCTRDPKVLMKVIQDNKMIKLEVMEGYSSSQEDNENVVKRAKDWYIALRKFSKNDQTL